MDHIRTVRTERALHAGNLAETRHVAIDDPTEVGILSLGRVRRVHLPAGRRRGEAGLDILARQCRAELQLGKSELLDRFAALVHHARLQQQAGLRLDPEHVAVAIAVLRLEQHGVRIETRHATGRPLANRVVVAERTDRLRQQRRKGLPRAAPVFDDDLFLRQVAAHLVIDADDLARAAIQHFQPLHRIALGIDVMRDTRGFDVRAALIDESADVGRTLRGAHCSSEKGKRLRLSLSQRALRDQQGRKQPDCTHDHRRSSVCGSETPRA